LGSNHTDNHSRRKLKPRENRRRWVSESIFLRTVWRGGTEGEEGVRIKVVQED
jgi:hypothetical protein